LLSIGAAAFEPFNCISRLNIVTYILDRKESEGGREEKDKGR
jgi:hypothetical protein